MLIANDSSATFKDIVNLTVNGGLSANSATLAAAQVITIGDNGQFASSSADIALPPGTKLTLGKSAGFASTGDINTFDALEELYIGPASTVTLDSQYVTLVGLKKLRLQDSASFSVPNSTYVNYTLDEPAIQGKKSLLAIQYAPGAVVDLVISGDTAISDTIPYVVTKESTLTVAEGVTLTVPDSGVLDLSALALPTTADPEIPVQISGAIQIAEGGTVIGPNLAGLSDDDKRAMYTAFNFGSGGKVVLDWGATFTMGDDVKLVGGNGGGYAYEWCTTSTDGAQIEISGSGITMRDTIPTAGTYAAAITVGGGYSFILKEHTLTLERGVTLTVPANQTLGFGADTDGGAKLVGLGGAEAGKIEFGETTISGGQSGWQAYGASPNLILIGYDGTDSSITPTATGITLKALGAGPTITQGEGSGNNLSIVSDITIDLGGTITSKWGQIILKGDTDAGKITFAGAGKITTGNSPAGAAAGFSGFLATNGTSTTTALGIENVFGDGSITKAATNVVLNSTTNKFPSGYLVSIDGAAGGTVEGGASDDGVISAQTPTNAIP